MKKLVIIITMLSLLGCSGMNQNVIFDPEQTEQRKMTEDDFWTLTEWLNFIYSITSLWR